MTACEFELNVVSQLPSQPTINVHLSLMEVSNVPSIEQCPSMKIHEQYYLLSAIICQIISYVPTVRKGKRWPANKHLRNDPPSLRPGRNRNEDQAERLELFGYISG